MMQWSKPALLAEYRDAPTGPGVYVVGHAADDTLPVSAIDKYDAYLGTWPDNFTGLYIGISESPGRGIRGRLSSHARKRGNKGLASYIVRGVELYYITIPQGNVTLKSLLLLLKQPSLFPCNIRSELKRNAARQRDIVRAEMGEENWSHFQGLDMGDHGEGM